MTYIYFLIIYLIWYNISFFGVQLYYYNDFIKSNHTIFSSYKSAEYADDVRLAIIFPFVREIVFLIVITYKLARSLNYILDFLPIYFYKFKLYNLNKKIGKQILNGKYPKQTLVDQAEFININLQKMEKAVVEYYSNK